MCATKYSTSPSGNQCNRVYLPSSEKWSTWHSILLQQWGFRELSNSMTFVRHSVKSSPIHSNPCKAANIPVKRRNNLSEGRIHVGIVGIGYMGFFQGGSGTLFNDPGGGGGSPKSP